MDEILKLMSFDSLSHIINQNSSNAVEDVEMCCSTCAVEQRCVIVALDACDEWKTTHDSGNLGTASSWYSLLSTVDYFGYSAEFELAEQRIAAEQMVVLCLWRLLSLIL